MSFWSSQLILALVLNAAVQAIQIGSYAARLAGVKSGRIGTSISLFNLFVTASRLANLVYAPMLGTISDRASAAIRAHADPALVEGGFSSQIRLIILAGTVGTTIGALLLPTFVHMFLRGVSAFERYGSLPRAIARVADPRILVGILGTLRVPPLRTFSRFSIRAVSAKFLIANVVVTGIYAIGVVAAAYASVLDPSVARTALLLSGIVNGIATVSFTLIVDPTSALVVDQAVKGERSVDDVRSMVYYLALSAIVGTLLSQLILYPAALLIASVAHLVAHFH